MKRIKGYLVYYLAVLFIILQLVSQISSQNHYSHIITPSYSSINTSLILNQDNDILKTINYSPPKCNMRTCSYDLRTSNQVFNEFYLKSIVSETARAETQHLSQIFQYKVINEEALKAYLETRSSFLINEPYFSSIINVAKDFNLNPILLFAITGQEQGFVPNNNSSASKIANNPFNVFCSWQDYNTDIIDSTQIACRTIINLSKEKPDDIDTLTWINRKYSADKNWSNGVNILYNDINIFIDNYTKKNNVDL